MPAPSNPPPPAPRPPLHRAEGELFREVVAAAGAELGLAVVRGRGKELPDRWAAATALAAADLQRHLAELGRTLGPPWRQDQKLATLAAWLALAESGKTPPAYRRDSGRTDTPGQPPESPRGLLKARRQGR